MVKNPFEIDDDGQPVQGEEPGLASEKQPQKGTRPVCPSCHGRVHQVLGLGQVERWVCQAEGGVVTPQWVEDPMATLPVRFAPAESTSTARPRGLRPGDIQVAVQTTRPR
jgi:hypothetical protein